MKLLKYTFIIAALITVLFSCEKDDGITGDPENDKIPTITSMNAGRDTIKFGGDTTLIVCEAMGGSLNYLWEVDLGNLDPVGDGSTAIFSGGGCCVGMKTIKCKVSNSKGYIDGTADVFILEP